MYHLELTPKSYGLMFYVQCFTSPRHPGRLSLIGSLFGDRYTRHVRTGAEASDGAGNFPFVSPGDPRGLESGTGLNYDDV
jgi:hypothetical protein